MIITKTFVVHASPDATWQFLTDPSRVAQCLPGAAITGQIDERTHAGTVTMKVGPVTASFKGTLRFERMDAATRSVEIAASGQDTRGKGGADMRMTSRLIEKGPGETEVTIESDVKIIGTLAQFGRGIIQDVSDQVFDRFVTAVRAQLEPQGAVPGVAAVATTSAPSTAAATAVPDTGVRAESVATPPAAPPVPAVPPVEVLSTASYLARRAAGRAARRPLVWAGAAVVVIVAYWLFR
jgi:carbon monoxide dehydrogenase subunit G